MSKMQPFEELKLRAEQLNEVFDLTGREFKKILSLYGASQREFGVFIGKSASTVNAIDSGGRVTRQNQQQLAMFVGGMAEFLSLKLKIRGVPL